MPEYVAHFMDSWGEDEEWEGWRWVKVYEPIIDNYCKLVVKAFLHMSSARNENPGKMNNEWNEIKIEIGESLFYSWLCHVKGYQIVQTNWEPSSSLRLQYENRAQSFKWLADAHLQDQFGHSVFKNNSLSQLFLQSEVDVLGISWNGSDTAVYTIDVAFHEGGFKYRGRR